MASRYLINVFLGHCFKLIMCKDTYLISKKEKKEEKMLIPYYIIEKKKGLQMYSPTSIYSSSKFHSMFCCSFWNTRAHSVISTIIV